MSADDKSPLSDPATRARTAFLAGIGHVCLQWSLLELTIQAVLNLLEDAEPERGDLLFGWQDMIPRFSMAITLADYHRAPGAIITELKAIRKELQENVRERRNQAVHGAHADAETLGTFNLRMARWRGAKKVQPVTVEDMVALTEEIHALQRRTYQVFETIGEWKQKRGLKLNPEVDLSDPPGGL